MALASLGRYNESIPFFDKALAINPNSVNALAGKGVDLGALGKYRKESIPFFDKALATDPMNKAELNGKKLSLRGLNQSK